ncbi:phenylacetate--CoA ligase family protein [Kocuria rosea]|uniref:phenylacetate--CoA ligase family protein n=1 Tax=Kocuria rosea TaxID=1275 RepID=UPI002010CB53|nr:phenylacetate--CoA ligase family protein [Kocuria rosea]
MEISKARADPAWANLEVRKRLSRVMHIASSAPYYADNAAYAGLVRQIDALERLEELPILSRRSVTESSRAMLTVPESEVSAVSTSGSSGEPVVFYLDKRRGASEWAYVMDSWSSSGVTPNDWRAYFRGMDLPRGASYQLQRSTRELVIRAQTVSPRTIDQYCDMLERRRIRYLHGYASTLSLFAVLCEQMGWASWRSQVMGVFPVSEEITSNQRAVLSRVFPNAGVVDFYGLSERTAFAAGHGDGSYSFYPLYGLVEVIREDGSPAQSGERGRIIATGLRLKAMPLLRYDTGDSAEVVHYEPSGMPRIREIRPRRSRENFVTADGGNFALTAMNMHGHLFASVLRFRFVQEIAGHATMLIQPAPGATSNDLEEVFQHMQRRCAGQVTLSMRLVEDLPPTVNGKARLLEQRIPNASASWL